MRILGIDPGYANTGWGVVDFDGRNLRPVSYGVIRTASKTESQKRIYSIAKAVSQLASRHEIDRCGMEDIFFTKNVSSAINVAKVIGAISSRLMEDEIPVTLYSPMTIKTTVTGYGLADKNQVQQMVKVILSFKSAPRPDHAADALAAAICLARSISFSGRLV